MGKSRHRHAAKTGIVLDDAEIAAITKRKRHPAQARVLFAAKIKHIIRPDGSLIVLRSHVEHLLGGEQKVRLKPEPEPNWNNL